MSIIQTQFVKDNCIYYRLPGKITQVTQHCGYSIGMKTYFFLIDIFTGNSEYLSHSIQDLKEKKLIIRNFFIFKLVEQEYNPTFQSFI